MSPRPGRIVEIANVPMSYPRGASDFAELRTRLLKRLNFAVDVGVTCQPISVTDILIEIIK